MLSFATVHYETFSVDHDGIVAESSVWQVPRVRLVPVYARHAPTHERSLACFGMCLAGLRVFIHPYLASPGNDDARTHRRAHTFTATPGL